MNNALNKKELSNHQARRQNTYDIENALIESWKIIAPYWPLKNFIAVNPLSGFENFPFDQAISYADKYFRQKSHSKEVLEINKHSIKWLQTYFDSGQSILSMPDRSLGLLKSFLGLAKYDNTLKKAPHFKKYKWLLDSNVDADTVILKSLSELKISESERMEFFSLLLTTLPGWAAYIKFKEDCEDEATENLINPASKKNYLALRLLLTLLIYPNARELLSVKEDSAALLRSKADYQKILSSEKAYKNLLLKNILNCDPAKVEKPKAQFIFCIDVRSEPMRRTIEGLANYETFGFAGFFGLPLKITNEKSGKNYNSCPVLIKPSHTIREELRSKNHEDIHQLKLLFKNTYRSLKYGFSTPFALAEAMGLFSGIWLAIRTLFPKMSIFIKKKLLKDLKFYEQVYAYDLDTLSMSQKCEYAETALRMMGLTQDFSPLVILCGHGSQTENNAYHTALDCGACGGHSGAPNARILAQILNDLKVREHLSNKNIYIPNTTQFIGAAHNTTTQKIDLFEADCAQIDPDLLNEVREILKTATKELSISLSRNLKPQLTNKLPLSNEIKAYDWSEIRPEWGLAKNASFIIGPRSLTKNIDLGARSFLHSYDWEKDPDSIYLTTILTAPVIVAQWINAQYLFSTLDNVAFGAGSKVTKNITSKIGVMQGNASDLMNGLPIQSVFRNNIEPYHEPIRLMVFVYAPQEKIKNIVTEQEVLKKLVKNNWIFINSIDPKNRSVLTLDKNLEWVDQV